MMRVNYPYLPPDFCPDCGSRIPTGESCSCYAGCVFTRLLNLARTTP